MREGLPLPAKIQNAPTLGLGLQIFWAAFMDLNSCRSSGWGQGPIPWVAMKDYADAFEFDYDLKTELFAHIRAMDNAYLLYEQAKRAKTDPIKPKSAPTGKV